MYLDPGLEYLVFDSAAKRFLMVAGVEGKFLPSSLYLMTCSLIIFGSAGCMGLITCVRRANENARDLILLAPVHKSYMLKIFEERFISNIYKRRCGDHREQMQLIPFYA